MGKIKSNEKTKNRGRRGGKICREKSNDKSREKRKNKKRKIEERKKMKIG